MNLGNGAGYLEGDIDAPNGNIDLDAGSQGMDGLLEAQTETLGGGSDAFYGTDRRPTASDTPAQPQPAPRRSRDNLPHHDDHHAFRRRRSRRLTPVGGWRWMRARGGWLAGGCGRAVGGWRAAGGQTGRRLGVDAGAGARSVAGGQMAGARSVAGGRGRADWPAGGLAGGGRRARGHLLEPPTHAGERRCGGFSIYARLTNPFRCSGGRFGCLRWRPGAQRPSTAG